MNPEHRARLAENLRKLMAKRGWSQSELARRAGVGRDNLSRYLHQKYVPSVKHLHAIAGAFGVSPTDLYAENGLQAEDEYVEFKTLPKDATRALVRINKVLPVAIAVQLMDLLTQTKK